LPNPNNRIFYVIVLYKMSGSRNSNTKAIIQAITSAKNEIIAEIQRAHHYGSQSTGFSSTQGPMTMDELKNSIPDDDSNESIQYASKGPMTLNELMDSIQPDNSKGPMTLAELDSPSPNNSHEVILIAGRSRKQMKSRRMKRTGRGKSRKYLRYKRK
jgi:hypothetical protein